MRSQADAAERSSTEERLLYVLVILRGGRNADDDEIYAAEHRRFISSLIKHNLILLGGAFGDVVGDAHAAYVLRCGSVEEARAIAAEDPFAKHDVVRPDCVEWQLVGINPNVINAAAVIRPTDV
jgi:uncharacterized protein YciI